MNKVVVANELVLAAEDIIAAEEMARDIRVAEEGGRWMTAERCERFVRLVLTEWRRWDCLVFGNRQS